MTDAPYIATGYEDLNPTEELISQRRSLRGFLPTTIPMETIERILYLAGRAPSGTNMQPWLCHALTGPALERLTTGLMAATNDPDVVKESEFPYYSPKILVI